MLWWYCCFSGQCIINIWCRLRAVSLFSVVRRTKRETRKWPRAWLMARDGRDNSFSSRAAALVSPLSRLRRSRARALSLLNLKKKINCSQSVYDEKTETHTSYLSLLKLELDNALQEFKRSTVCSGWLNRCYSQTSLYGHPRLIIRTPHYYGQFALSLGKESRLHLL